MRNLINLFENINLEALAKKDPHEAANTIRANPQLPVSHAVMLAIVKSYGWNIRLFPNAPEDVQLAAVSVFPEVIEIIPQATELVQINAVSRDPSVVRFITNPSPEVQDAAVHKNAMCIRYLEHPSDELQMWAFDKAHGAFYETKHPCNELCLAGIKEFGIRVLTHRGVKWTKNLIKSVMDRSPEDAYECVSQCNLPKELLRYAFEKNYKCYNIISKKPEYDGYLDVAYAKKTRQIDREQNLPLFGHGDTGDFNQDQLRLMRWFKTNGVEKITVRELRKQPWGNTPYFNELVKQTGGRDITKADLKNASSTPISQPTLDLMSHASIGVTTWTGAQRLFSYLPNKVAVFSVPFSIIRTLTADDASLKKIAAVNRRGGHPVAPTKNKHKQSFDFDFDPTIGNMIGNTDDLAGMKDDTAVTLGWVRYTVFGKDIWIDEVQTDLSKLLPPEAFVNIKDLQDAIMLEFLKRMRRRGAEKFFMPTFDLKKSKYSGFGDHLPPENVYRDLPRKMRFHQGIIKDLDPLVDGEKAWILESKGK